MTQIKAGLQVFQNFIHFFVETIQQAFSRKVYWRDIFYQFDRLGAGSLIIVAFTGLFTGLVFTLQTGTGMQRFGVANSVGKIVVLGIVKELGPVLSALVFSGRAGAAIAAHISSMVVTEQIEAIEAEGISPIKRVVISRVVACVVMLPLLTIIADAMALFGGALICEYSLGVSSSIYWSDVTSFLQPADAVMGAVKPVVFGLTIGLCGAFYGLSAQRDARGVGVATTKAVVVSTIAVILLDFLITKLMIYIAGR